MNRLSHFSFIISLGLCVIAGNMISTAAAQSGSIVRQGGGAIKGVSSDIYEAVAAASAHDTLYISGGNFGVKDKSLVIDKPLTLIGVGHNPNTAPNNRPTVFADGIVLKTGADGTTISGMKIVWISNFFEIKEGLRPFTVHNVLLKKCYFYGMNVKNFNSPCDNWQIVQNVIEGYVNCIQVNKWKIENNVLIGGATFPVNEESTLWRNNIFIAQYRYPMFYYMSPVFQNNIFISPDGMICKPGDFTEGTTLFSNIFNFKKEKYKCQHVADMGGNVYIEQPIFVKYSHTYEFDGDIYQYDFHLRPEIAKLKGMDGTERGIYGGRFPFES